MLIVGVERRRRSDFFRRGKEIYMYEVGDLCGGILVLCIRNVRF